MKEQKLDRFSVAGSCKTETGMYDPRFEHDNCGIGAVVNIKGIKTHATVENALKIVENLKHRAGKDAEGKTGDGVGILLQVSHKFFSKVTKPLGIELGDERDYGVGMFFFPQDELKRNQAKKMFEVIVNKEGMEFLGWREVPTDPTKLGQKAVDCMPYIMQGFVKRPAEVAKGLDFDRKLYVARRVFEQSNDDTYGVSLSSRTIVYKGMFLVEQLRLFFADLQDKDYESAIATVHSRFSTNTNPSWERAHPNRFIVHNGEINTIKGNADKMLAREETMESEHLKGELQKVLPVINSEGSDSAMLDNYLQFLHLSGFSLPRAVMMTIPEPWENNADMDPAMKAFYEYHSCITEPWDGPAAVAFTDGRYVGATLDRNGLRPARYYLTSDDMIILSSEVGVTDVDESTIIKKERLHPGKMLLIDTEKGKIISDEEIKKEEALHKPYAEWVKKTLVELDNLPLNTGKKGDTWHDLVHKLKDNAKGNVNEHLLLKNFIVLENMFVNRENSVDKLSLLTRQKAFGYTWEDVNTTIKSIVEKADDPIGAMGADIPLAVLSEKPQLLYNYFKQLFAQVTNPPIDAIREQIVTSTYTLFGCEQNLLTSSELNCRKVRALSPILTNEELEKLRNIDLEGFKSITIPSLFNVKQENDMETAMDTIFEAADIAIENGYNIIILSDKGVDKDKAPIPALLVASGLHHHLIRKGTRMKVSIVLESGEPREVHHFACLVGYGVNGINPYMAYEAIKELSDEKLLEYSYEDGVKRFNKACTKGIVKIMSKMGISTIQSYQGAQIFEALGISESVVNKYFTGTTTRIGGMGIEHIQKEVLLRHAEAFDKVNGKKALKTGGDYKWRAKGEYHMFNPESIYKLQMACRTGNYKLYKEYAKEMDEHQQHQCTIRGMLDIKTIDKPIAIDQVESVESIVKRFKTGAMSYGSISQEAHECLAIAMNRLGGK